MKIKIKPVKILEYFAVLLMIILSGCVFFTQVYRFETTIVFVFITLLLLWQKHQGVSQRNIINIFVAGIFLFLNLFGNMDSLSSANYKDYIILFIEIICVICVLSVISPDEFQKKYVVIMTGIALISLCCFYIQITDTDFVKQIADIKILPGYTISWFHTWGWGYIFGRNAGPFWEPGAFQGYIILAILFIFNKRKLKGNYPVLAILAFTVLTTMSTAGYILLGIMFAYFVVLYSQESNKKSKDLIFTIIKIVLLLAIAVVAIQYILTSNTVTNKFMSSNESYARRLLDIVSSWDIVVKRPLFGYGIMSVKLVSVWNSFGMTGNSSGIFAALQFFGVFFGTVLIIKMFWGAVRTYQNLNRVIIIAIFFLLFMTESLITYPIYMGFMYFTNRNTEERVCV
ncbi:O-antigen ligase family protein [Faecalicatena sp. AGMB00832]|uniref:O-antigen ligase family protein n=1 Tax=Faecalicatena faecalis TaxID=2726362 RepID=A0ABS6DBA9_9FIRM|nr:O-antigen ligase family protein [Faecalicatena faecalis]MBU3878753.1 O-antigen ligase family protein [Faecalicatena faecalis]